MGRRREAMACDAPSAWRLITWQFAARAKAVKTNASATVFELFPEPVKVQAEVAKTGSSPRTIWLNGLKPSGVDCISTSTLAARRLHHASPRFTTFRCRLHPHARRPS